jgi:GNAT superfamily N-acetyltransferase
MTDVQVRRIQSGEGPTLRDIRLRALSDSPAAFGETLDEAASRPAAHYEDVARACAAATEQTGFFAEDGDGRTVGMVRAFRDHAGVELVGMWVAPEARGRGAGAALVDAVIGWARAAGAEAVLLQHADGNMAARRLYERCGFVETGELTTMRSNPSLCRHHMRLALR